MTLSVDAFGQIGYQWFKVVGTTDDADDILVSTSNDLKFASYTADNAGEYYIRLSMPGVACQIADIPYTLAAQSNRVSGSTAFVTAGKITLGASDLSKINSVEVVNLAGIKVYSALQQAVSAAIDTKHLASGMYIFRIRMSDGSELSKEILVIR